MNVTDHGSGWDPRWLRATASWACEQLGIAAMFPIAFKPGVGSGRAHYVTNRFGTEWNVIVRLSSKLRTYPMMPHDRRIIGLVGGGHLTISPVMPLRSADEHLLFVLGHELWHLVDPFSSVTDVSRRGPDFVLMEQRCDEAGIKLVALSRESGELRRRQERAIVNEIPAPASNYRELLERVRRARN